MSDETVPNQELVLIVDDLPSNLVYFKEALDSFGYQTLTSENGKQALDKIHATPPDLVLSDVNMPGLDGYELCQRVKENPATRDIPIILITAQDDRNSLVRGLSLGADDFLIKPVNLSELQARVRNLLLVKAYRDHMKRYTAELETQVSIRTQELNEAFEKLKDVNMQLRGSTMDTIHRLSVAAEYRDSDTGNHLWRMSHFAQAIGRQLGLGEEIVDNILYSSPMHDVGKIGTPDQILLKPGKLTKNEMSIMEQHTLIGEKILSGSDNPLLKLASENAGAHHERWDGSGYPRGRAGDEIPLAARITTIADVYDALTTERVYKTAWSEADAFKLIESEAGSHFDPDCVSAFVSARSKILDMQHARAMNKSE